jgi:hypothetical protein
MSRISDHGAINAEDFSDVGFGHQFIRCPTGSNFAAL